VYASRIGRWGQAVKSRIATITSIIGICARRATCRHQATGMASQCRACGQATIVWLRTLVGWFVQTSSAPQTFCRRKTRCIKATCLWQSMPLVTTRGSLQSPCKSQVQASWRQGASRRGLKTSRRRSKFDGTSVQRRCEGESEGREREMLTPLSDTQ